MKVLTIREIARSGAEKGHHEMNEKDAPKSMWISVTGLRVRRLWHYPKFLRLTGCAMAQARAAEGNLRAETRTVGGIHHTLSVWRNREAMRDYMTAGAHLEAMQAFERIATGYGVGYQSTEVPDWAHVPDIWAAGRNAEQFVGNGGGST